MPFYIAPYEDFDYPEVSQLAKGNFSVLIYKKQNDSFGITEHDHVSDRFYNSIKGCTWYSVTKKLFFEIDDEIYSSNKFHLKGFLFFNPTPVLSGLIVEAKNILKTINTNELLKRYGKQLLTINQNRILDSYNGVYNQYETNFLLHNDNVVLVGKDSYFKTHVVFCTKNNEIILNFLKLINDEEILKCKSISEIPYW